MTGQIPPYGKNFRLVSLAYTPELANRAYYLKRDDRWFIRSDKKSKVWQVYRSNGSGAAGATAMGKPLPSLTRAMAKLLDGIDQGYYEIRENPS